MSVSKFCEHSGLWNLNPGDAVRMDSGETIAQWRRVYFQKFGIRVPEDQSGWDWPEGLSLTASLVKSGVPISNMPKNSDCSNLVVPSGGLVRGLVATSQNSSSGVEDNHVTDCFISRCSTVPKFTGRGPENVCKSTYIDSIGNSASLATAHRTLQNHRNLVKNSDVSSGKGAWVGAIMDKDASSSMELKLGQPYQQNQSSGNSVLPVIGQQFHNTLVNSQKPFPQEQMIHNVTSFRGEKESRLFPNRATGPSNSTTRREQGHLGYGSCVINNAMDGGKVELLRGNIAKTSGVSLFKHYSIPEGSSNSKATNNLLNLREHVIPEMQHCESHFVNCEPIIVPWNGGNGLDKQYMLPDLGCLKSADKGKGVGCLADIGVVKTTHIVCPWKESRTGKCSNSSVKVQHSFVEPSTSEEQRHVPNLSRKQDVSEVAMKSDQSGPTSLNRWCNFSTLTQGLPLQCKEIGKQCQLSYNPLQNEQSSLRLGKSQNNITLSNEHDNCCQRTLYFQYNCGCAAHTCIGGKCNFSGNSSNSLREQTESLSCKTPMLVASQFAKDYIVPKENSISFGQCETLKGQLSKNISCNASQWKDVPSKVKRVCEVASVRRPSDALDERGPEDGAAKCSHGAVHTADSSKDQDMSNISSGCSTPAVTQASIEVTNVDSSTVVGNTGYVDNLIVDEGSGIDKCWSSDDAFESDRSTDFYGHNCKTNERKEGSCKGSGNKSSRSLLDEVKLMDSLTWKKSQSQNHSLTVCGKTNQSHESGRGLKTGKRKREMKLKVLDASLHTAPPVVHDKYPECDVDWPCLSNNMLMISSGPESSRTCGAHSVKINTKHGNSTLPVTKAPSHKRDLRRLYNARDRENDHDREMNCSDNSCKILKISDRKKFRSTQTADMCMQFQMQESTPAKAKPVVCGNYGEIVNGNMTGDVTKSYKIVSLDKILKTARRCSLPKNCKPGLTSSREWKSANFSWSNACFDKFSKLKKEKENWSNDDLESEEMNIHSPLEERDVAFASGDEQSADEFSVLEKREDKSRKVPVILDNANGQSKTKYKETRKRSIYELTLKGMNPSPKMVSQNKIFKCKPKIKLQQILKNSDKNHIHGSRKVDAKRYVREQKHLSITDINSLCCVCGSSNKDDVNCLLECGRCSIRVHQACYGVSKVPKGHWYCRPCRTSSKNIVCVLCGYGGGAMTRALRSRTIVKSLLKVWNLDTECRPKNAISSAETMQDGLNLFYSSESCTTVSAGVLDSTVKQWVHMVCGLWTPGTRCPNVDTMSAFDVSGASHPRANVVCSMCNRPGGSCIQCRDVNCSVQFHPWCAHQKGLLQSEAEGIDNENVGFYGRCATHATGLANESACDAANIEAGYTGEKEASCARTEGYKGRKRDGFWHDINSQSNGRGGCLVPQEQVNAWVYINGQKSCAQGLSKLPISEKEYDCRKEYARYKQAKGWKHLVVYKSGIHALGLYTSRFISRGEMVVEYVGEIVGLRVADKRENEYQSGKKLQYKSACYFFRIDKEHIIDATRKGGIARFVNHSCLPNCVAKIICVRNEKKVVFFAERDIYPGEEITYDYHFNHEDEVFFHANHHRSDSPTRVNLYTTSSPHSHSFRFSIGRSSSPNRSITVSKQNNPISLPKKTCMCSPTTHPGSFRCSLHKNTGIHSHGSGTALYTPNRLNMRRSAMKNSLVRIGGVEGEWVKRALTALIRPSSHQQRRRADFQPRPSRLVVMSKADDI
ncbi:hypothetical protein GH714_039444 [Hevea brasiliensis]|uniref:Histone-lysine N-methyltransferase n=1 Tax=Hevea brasiliensis TaxID=3981 RepID=A0A6A6KE82_HEVBR|nr:hypothetical protein GH714_039444 [Hevea brasiliensis]